MMVKLLLIKIQRQEGDSETWVDGQATMEREITVSGQRSGKRLEFWVGQP